MFKPRGKPLYLYKRVGDKPMEAISGDDMLDFRQWWLERLEVEGPTPNSANKDLIRL